VGTNGGRLAPARRSHLNYTLSHLFRWGWYKTRDCRPNVPAGIHSQHQRISPYMNVCHDGAGRWLHPRFVRLRELNEVAADKRPDDEAGGRIHNVDGGIRIAVVLGQELIEAVRVLAALGVLACGGDLLALRIGGRAAGCKRGFVVLDGDGEAAGVRVAGHIYCRNGYGGGAYREDRARRWRTVQGGYAATIRGAGDVSNHGGALCCFGKCA
jgi:hypothetical protein